MTTPKKTNADDTVEKDFLALLACKKSGHKSSWKGRL